MDAGVFTHIRLCLALGDEGRGWGKHLREILQSNKLGEEGILAKDREEG